MVVSLLEYGICEHKHVLSNRPTGNSRDSKDAITKVVHSIEKYMFTRFLKRLDTCIQVDGQHVSDIIFRKLLFCYKNYCFIKRY